MPIGRASEEERAQVGAALRRARERAGLSMQTLGQLAEHDGIRQIEIGASTPSVATLFRLAKALNCSWTDLLGPPPGAENAQDADWQAGYRAGVSDAISALRELGHNGTSQP